MEPYKSSSGKQSGVSGYELADDTIVIEFGNVLCIVIPMRVPEEKLLRR